MFNVTPAVTYSYFPTTVHTVNTGDNAPCFTGWISSCHPTNSIKTLKGTQTLKALRKTHIDT